MRMPLSLKIAIHFNQGYRGEMLSFISIISIIGIALGITVLIISLSAMNGFERELKNRVLSIIPHGEIEPISPLFENWKTILQRIERVSGILAASPYLNFTGLIERNSKLLSIQIKGVDPVLEMKVSALPQYVKDDAWLRFKPNHRQIIIGKGIADTLKVKVGDWLTIMISNSTTGIRLLHPKYIRLQVSGIFILNGQLDHRLAMVPLSDAQNYFQCGTDIDGIAIKVKDVFNATKLVQDAGRITHAYVKSKSWINTYGYMYRDIQMIRCIIYIAMVLIMGVASFNVVSILVIAVKEKNSDIAILRTLGAKSNLIYAIFVYYGLIANLIGSIIGMLVGTLIAFNLTFFIKVIEHFLGQKLLSGKIYFIDFVPTEIYWLDIVTILVTSLLLSLLASLYPAWRASRIYPAKILNAK